MWKMRLMTIAALLALLPGVGRAQREEMADSVFARAQRMVAEGRGDEGRELVDKTLASSPVGSPEYIGALYWRGVIAPTAAQAERDLRRVVVEYGLSPYGDDALLRLAQLEAARGDKARAVQHLQFLVREHAKSELRGRAQLTLARLQFESGDAPAACTGLANASAAAAATDVELHNQIAFEQRKCAGVSLAAQPGVAAPVDSAARPVVKNAAAAAVDAAVPPPRQSSGIASAVPPVQNPPPARESSASSSASTEQTGAYSVQVGAFSTVEKARQVQSELMARGYDARVLTGTLFRVRIGRYPSRDRADEALERMRGSGIQGFVVEVEQR
jgi:cell division septation protein DedD